MTSLVVVIGLSLGVSGLCSILEAVLLSVSHSYVALLVERGDRAGHLLRDMRTNIDQPIAAILTLNTIAHTVGAAVGGAIALQVFGERWIAVFSAVLTLAILLFSEIVPKTIGASYWKVLARPAARFLRFLIVVMKPILVPLAAFNRIVTPTKGEQVTVSRAELDVLAEIGHREGAIDQDEWRVMTNVMNLDRVKVGAVMTPRTSVIAVPVDATVEDAKSLMVDTGRLRLPVYEGTVDEIVGILLARDLWRADRDGAVQIREIMRPPTFVPETKSVEDLITEMRRQRIKMAIVLDEFGGTAGLVTLEDLIEEIVGEIHDEHEKELAPFEEREQGELLIAGSVTVREFNDRVGAELPESLVDTLAGYVFNQVGRIPRVGDEVTIGSGTLRVHTMDRRRVRRVLFIPRGRGSAARRVP